MKPNNHSEALNFCGLSPEAVAQVATLECGLRVLRAFVRDTSPSGLDAFEAVVCSLCENPVIVMNFQTPEGRSVEGLALNKDLFRRFQTPESSMRAYEKLLDKLEDSMRSLLDYDRVYPGSYLRPGVLPVDGKSGI
jgi:hypothetical protein